MHTASLPQRHKVRLQSAMQAVELGQDVLMFLSRPLDALRGRQALAPAIVALHPSPPLEAGRLVVNLRIPNEVGGERVAKVVAGSVPGPPSLDARPVDRLECRAGVPVLVERGTSHSVTPLLLTLFVEQATDLQTTSLSIEKLPASTAEVMVDYLKRTKI